MSDYDAMASRLDDAFYSDPGGSTTTSTADTSHSKKTRRSRNKDRPAPASPPATAIGMTDTLTRYAVVYGSDEIWDTQLLIPMKPVALRLAIGQEHYKAWFADLRKRVVQPSEIVFDPTGKCSESCINLFQGLAMKPKPGDCTAMMELLDHLLSDSADTEQGIADVREFVLNWLAYPLQHPGAKMATALIVHGPQGTGKNLFFESYARIFGEYAMTVGQAQLESRYNDYASRKLFLIGDEIVASSELSHVKNILKSMITGESIQIEAKFAQLRTERNHMNIVFLSNDAKPMALEADDRRHVVIWAPAKRTDELYDRVVAANKNGGIEAFYAALMARDLTGFHTHSPPPHTRAKADLVELGLRPAERFTKEWLTGAINLPLHPCSSGQIYKGFTRWCRASGERFPPNQANFTAAAIKYAKDRLSVKVCAPGFGDTSGSTVRLWVPAGTGPLNGVTWFQFATEAIAAFEGPLSRFGATFNDVQD